MKLAAIMIPLMLMSANSSATELKSDQMCQDYLKGLFGDIRIAEEVGMQALQVSLNRIADTHPEHLELATQIAFGTALDDAGHRRVGQYINAMCTKEGTILIDLVYEVLLTESKRIAKEREAKSKT